MQADVAAIEAARGAPRRERWRPLGTAVAVAIAFGIAEWAGFSRAGSYVAQGADGRTLVGIAVLYGLAGLACGVVASGLGRFASRPGAAVGLPLAALVVLAVARSAGGWRVGLAALALGLLVFRGLVRGSARWPALARPAPWWLGVGAGLSLLLLASAPAAADGFGRAAALAFGVVGLAAVALAVLRSSGGATLGGLVALAAVVCAGWLGVRIPRPPTAATPPPDAASVLMVTIDTLRADRVGAYGYAPARTPNLDGLAAQGTLFAQTVAPTVFTGPSHASILTGRELEHHGVLLNKVKLPESVPTLADVLGRAGWATAAFVSSFTTQDSACGLPSRSATWDDDLSEFRWFPWLAYRMVLFRELERALTAWGLDFTPLYRPGADTTDAALAWLERNGERPFFVWVHLFDPHLPYRPPDAFRSDADRAYRGPATGAWYRLDAAQRAEILRTPGAVEHMRSLYDAEIAYADAQLGRLVEAARSAAPGGRLVVVATSDHGEPMGEHDLFWFRDLYDDTLLVPLVIAAPGGRAGARIVSQVRLIDVAPTVLDLLGVEPAPAVDGRSLAPALRGEALPAPAPAFSAVHVSREENDRPRSSVRTGGWKLLRRERGWHGGSWQAPRLELYDLRTDRGELDDLSARADTVAARLSALLEGRAAGAEAVELDLSDVERARLRELGYVR